ncbi:MAG: DMT family transporter [Deltaproteobacteria bacterium]|jgi:drug/metabolite transporter (DMT)-like permease|nr:DMT family transporter [Deltaproteobacteria bacterium]
MSKKSALSLLALTALLWSSSGVLIKSADWNPLAVASARGLVAALTIRFLNPAGFSFSKLTPTHWLAGSSLALLSVFFVCAMKLTTAANTVAAQFTAPVWVVIFAPLLLKERSKPSDWFFIAAIFGGIALFFFDSLSPGGLLGNVLAVVSGIFFASQAMFLKKIKNDNPAMAMILGNFLCFLVFLPFWGAPWPDVAGMACVLALGVFQLGVSYYLYTLTLPRVSSLELVTITMLEPVLSPLWVFLAMGERPGKHAFLGCLVVIVMVFVWGVKKAKEEE